MFKFAILAVITALASQNLNQGWTFRQARGHDQHEAIVPGTVHSDLLRHGIIEDPFSGMNERSIQWVDKEDWIYQTEFIVEDDLATCRHIELCLDGIDTYSDVYVNDSLVLSTDNMFVRWRKEVKPILVSGKNRLTVYLHSPIKKGMPLFDALPFQYYCGNDQSQNGGIMDKRVSVFTRKAGYHYGWDWGPRIVPSGIWRPVRLEAWDDVRLDNVYYKQTEVSEKTARLDVQLSVLADKVFRNAQVRILADGSVVGTLRTDIEEGQSVLSVPCVVRKPHLWWPNGHGEAYRYEFEVEVLHDDEVLLSDCEKIGLRSIELDRSPEGTGFNFCFKVNGKPIFMKGANYIPCDILLDRVTDEIYEETVRSAKMTNMNMLRVWGGGIYENDRFYDLCDENGILIWQDFMFACSFYPADEAFLENIRREAEDNVIRLRNHPCIALWCGNNECNDAFYGWGLKNTYARQGHPEYDQLIERQMNAMYFDLLPSVVGKLDPVTDYTPSSPYCPQGKRGSMDIGDYHFWTPWHARQPISEYETNSARFMSEYGFQSFPTLPTVKMYAPQSKDWQINSDVMMFHQRGGAFCNDRIIQALREDYKVPENFDDILYMSQVVQGDAIKLAIESHRRDKPYCWGSLFWQFNDCWPVASWSSRDCYGTWKALQYYSTKAFANILVSPEFGDESVSFYLVSDLLEKVRGTLVVEVFDFQGNIQSSHAVQCTIPANSSIVVTEMDYGSLLAGAKENEVYMTMKFESKAGTADNLRLFVKDGEVQFPQCDIQHTVTATEDGYEVRLQSDCFAKAVWVSAGEIGKNFSDNFFYLLPGVEKKITIMTDMDEATFLQSLQIKHEI